MNYNFKNLVFEGGGVKGIAYGGALKKLDELGILPRIERVAGTSAGAINATLMALGYSSAEVSEIIAATSFKSFEDSSGFFLSNVLRLVKKFGWNKGDAFHDWIGELIKRKSGSKDLTFGELEEEITGGNQKGYRYLYAATTNLTQQKQVVFSHEMNRDLRISDAIRMSMSLPLFFQAYKFSNDFMVDGGLSYNYPVNIFDHERYLSNALNGDFSSGKFFNHETLGFRLDTREEIELAKKDWSLVPGEITGIKSYALALLTFVSEMANKVHLEGKDWNRTIFIDTLMVKTTDFELPREMIAMLLKSGEEGVLKYFEWRDSDIDWNTRPV